MGSETSGRYAWVWTEAGEAELRRLWRQGKTASTIAATMGNGLTRSAILGKAARIGLYRRVAKRAPRDRSRPPKHYPVAVVEEIRRRIPIDTRTWQQQFFGDPPEGRSALDKMRAKIGVNPHSRTVFHAINVAPVEEWKKSVLGIAAQEPIRADRNVQGEVREEYR
jgi:hypothetical protein